MGILPGQMTKADIAVSGVFPEDEGTMIVWHLGRHMYAPKSANTQWYAIDPWSEVVTDQWPRVVFEDYIQKYGERPLATWEKELYDV